jgi:translation initiation factor IF-2
MSRVTPGRDEPEGPPRTIRIPDPVAVRELASAMKLKPFAIIRDLMGFDLYVTLDSEIDFATASRLCAKHGIVARPTI